MSILQFVNVIYFAFQAVFMTVPSIWIVFVIVFWEGLLGGCCYVNTFNRISKELPLRYKAFGMGMTTIGQMNCQLIASMKQLHFINCSFSLFLGQSCGVVLAGLLAIPIHNVICQMPTPSVLGWIFLRGRRRTVIEFVNCLGAIQNPWCILNSKNSQLRFLSNPQTTVSKLLKNNTPSNPSADLYIFFLVDIYRIVISVEIMKLIVKWHLKIHTNMFTLCFFFPLFEFFIQLFKWNHLIDNFVNVLYIHQQQLFMTDILFNKTYLI